MKEYTIERRLIMKILLVCNLGMSTSMLVQRMEVEAKERGLTVEIAAVPYTVAIKEYANWDVIMLGPQVRHQFKKLVDTTKDITPVEIIDMKDYGMMNGKHVLDAAIKVVESK